MTGKERGVARPDHRCQLLQVTDLYDPREQCASYLINVIKDHEYGHITSVDVILCR